MNDLNFQQKIADCFILVVNLDQADQEINKALEYANNVEKSVKLMLAGNLSPEDLLESVEGSVPSIDSYIEEVEQNLYDLFVECPSLIL